MRKGKEQTSLVLMANLTSPSSDTEKWVSLARDFEQAGADLIEADLTCPHIGLPPRRWGQKYARNSGAEPRSARFRSFAG